MHPSAFAGFGRVGTNGPIYTKEQQAKLEELRRAREIALATSEREYHDDLALHTDMMKAANNRHKQRCQAAHDAYDAAAATV